jgi:hypothetical protein
MRAIKQNVITITLELTQQEAHWLQGVMQNPLRDIHPSEECIEDSEMREKFWHTLNTPVNKD